MNSIIWGYFAAYSYLVVVMGVAYFSFRLLKQNEVSRKIIHIATGLGWIILKVFIGPNIHSVIITFSFVVLTSLTYIFKVDFVERKNHSLGTIYYTVAMFVCALVSCSIPNYFDCFGIGIICLALGDGLAGLVGNYFNSNSSKKSIQGSLACFFASFFSIVGINVVFAIDLSIFYCVLLAMTATLIEYSTEAYDNLFVPGIVSIYAYALIYISADIDVLIGLALGGALCVLCFFLRVLTLNASILLLFLINIVYMFGGVKVFASLILIYSIAIVVDKILPKKRRKIIDGIIKDSGSRNLKQLSPNCIPASIWIVFWGITTKEVFLVCFFVAISEAIADSIASDIGVLSKKDPVDILTLRRTRPGVSGGITVLGTSASLLLCVYASVVAFSLYTLPVSFLIIIFVVSFFGVIIDSILGSKIQVKYRCTVCGVITEKQNHCGSETVYYSGVRSIDNIAVNWISNCISSIIPVVLLFV